MSSNKHLQHFTTQIFVHTLMFTIGDLWWGWPPAFPERQHLVPSSGWRVTSLWIGMPHPATAWLLVMGPWVDWSLMVVTNRPLILSKGRGWEVCWIVPNHRFAGCLWLPDIGVKPSTNDLPADLLVLPCPLMLVSASQNSQPLNRIPRGHLLWNMSDGFWHKKWTPGCIKKWNCPVGSSPNLPRPTGSAELIEMIRPKRISWWTTRFLHEKTNGAWLLAGGFKLFLPFGCFSK